MLLLTVDDAARFEILGVTTSRGDRVMVIFSEVAGGAVGFLINLFTGRDAVEAVVVLDPDRVSFGSNCKELSSSKGLLFADRFCRRFGLGIVDLGRLDSNSDGSLIASGC